MRKKAFIFSIVFIPLVAICQTTTYTHRIISKPDFIRASSLADSRLSILDSTSRVVLIGRCKAGCDFNIVKIDGYNNEFFALNQVRWNDGEDVLLEILLDSNDTGSVTYQNTYLYYDTLTMESFKNIDFRIPKGKKIELIHSGKNYAQVSVSIGGFCYTGFVKNTMIKDINFQKSNSKKCTGYGDNTIVRMKMYDDFVKGEYLIQSHYDNTRKQIRIRIEEHNNLLKVKVLEDTIFSNGKSSSTAVKDEYSQILIYDKFNKEFLFREYSYKFNQENLGTTKSGWSYSVEKIK